MKKFLTLVAAAFMAANVFAQSATPLVLKRGTSAGFAGETEVYDFMMEKNMRQHLLPAMLTLPIILSIFLSLRSLFLRISR